MAEPSNNDRLEGRTCLRAGELDDKPGDAISRTEQAWSIIYLNISDVVYHLSVEGTEYRFIDVNPAFYQATHLQPDQVIGKLVKDVIPEPSLSLVLSHYSEAIRTRATQRWEESSDYPAGRKVGQVSITPVFNSAGYCTDLVGTVHDISEIVNRETRLHEANAKLELAYNELEQLAASLRNDEHRLRLALEGTGEGVWDWRIDQDLVYYSDKWKSIVGIRGPILDRTRAAWLKRVHHADLPAMLERLDACLNSVDEIYSCTYRVWHESQHWIWVRSSGSVVERDANGKPLRMIGTLVDITHSVTMQQQLDASHARLSQLAKQVPGALFELLMEKNGHTTCTYISMMAHELFEFSPEELQADCRLLFDRIAPRDRSRLHRALQESAAHLIQLRVEFQVQLPKKGLRWREVIATPTRGDDGLTVWHGFTDDISLRKSTEQAIAHFNEKLEQRAHYDSLTGLPNRALFRDRLEQGIRRADAAGGQIALLFIDLDRFKEVNDLLGHGAGDALLIEAARRIEGCVRNGDTVARLGGDEFTVILTEANELAHIEQIAQQILDALSTPFRIKTEQVQVAGSIGIARFPADAKDTEELMRNADHAMYRSKSAGRNQLTFFEAKMQAAALRRLKLISDLRRALPEQQFVLYFQPIVNLKTNRIAKAEALLRWNRSTSELVAPLEFIDAAEESGLIHDIGDWVFCTAARHAKLWSAMLGDIFQISINKSPVQFQAHPGTLDWIDYLKKFGTSPGCINVEITEGLLLNLSDNVFSQLAELQSSGIEVSIDDFGTGYSSMSYLKRLDIDYLKIDQSFVAEMLQDNTSRTITETIIVMAHKLGLKVIAEGVETAAQRDWLVTHGCDYAQGFLFAPAVPADVFETMLAA